MEYKEKNDFCLTRCQTKVNCRLRKGAEQSPSEWKSARWVSNAAMASGFGSRGTCNFLSLTVTSGGAAASASLCRGSRSYGHTGAGVALVGNRYVYVLQNLLVSFTDGLKRFFMSFS